MSTISSTVISAPAPLPLYIGPTLISPSYGFTINSNTITAMTVTSGNNTRTLKLPSNATFVASKAGGLQIVTETIKGTNSTEVIVYTAQSPTSTSFNLTSDTLTYNSPSTTTGSGWTQGVSFNSSNGIITGYSTSTTYNGKTFTSNVSTPAGAIFTKNSNVSVTETLVQGNAIHTLNYVQPNATSSLFTLASDSHTYIQPGSSTTVLNVNPYDQLVLTFSGNTVSGVQSLAPNGVKTNMTLPSGVSFQEVTAGKTNFVQEIISHNNNTSYVLFLQSSVNSNYTEVAHGSGSSIDLVGLQAQLNQLPTANLALI
jgi:hypothetical protein